MKQDSFYVYLWINDSWGGIPFYVGKGSVNRYKSMCGRSKAFRAIVQNWKCHPEILSKNLSETIALKLESTMKSFYVENGYPIIDDEGPYRKQLSQRKGIEAMPVINGRKVSPKTGRPIGRPKKQPANFPEILLRQRAGQISVKEACLELGISRSQWYVMIKEAVA